jgi:integrase
MRWKLASLPTYLSAAQAQKILDGCDRTTALGRRDYAILMMLAKLGLRADEVATLTIDNIDWRSGEMSFAPRVGGGADANASRRRRSCRLLPA